MSLPEKSECTVTPLLTSLADLTSQREQDALSLSLGQAVRDLTHASSVTFYRLARLDAGLTLLPASCWREGIPGTMTADLPPPIPLSDVPQFEQALAREEITSFSTSAGMELVLPLGGHRQKAEGLFHVQGARIDATADRVLPLLLVIRKNFLDLLRDNQHDLLTGLLNRKTFDHRIGHIMARINSPHHRETDPKGGSGYCMAMLDIDHFKRINDNFGHLYGDEVLLLFANMMQASFREEDALFRFGGEEFVVLLKGIETSRAWQVLDRFRKKIENRDFPQVGRVTVSCGLTAIRSGDLPPQILDRADRALYFAKGHGRNQVASYETLVEMGHLQTHEISSGSIELF